MVGTVTTFSATPPRPSMISCSPAGSLKRKAAAVSEKSFAEPRKAPMSASCTSAPTVRSSSPIQVLDTGVTTTAGTLDPVSGDPCRFVVSNGNREMVVAQSGVIVGRFTQDGGLTYKAFIALPRHTPFSSFLRPAMRV